MILTQYSAFSLNFNLNLLISHTFSVGTLLFIPLVHFSQHSFSSGDNTKQHILDWCAVVLFSSSQNIYPPSPHTWFQYFELVNLWYVIAVSFQVKSKKVDLLCFLVQIKNPFFFFGVTYASGQLCEFFIAVCVREGHSLETPCITLHLHCEVNALGSNYHCLHFYSCFH